MQIQRKRVKSSAISGNFNVYKERVPIIDPKLKMPPKRQLLISRKNIEWKNI